jgi:hypothetical protein
MAMLADVLQRMIDLHGFAIVGDRNVLPRGYVLAGARRELSGEEIDQPLLVIGEATHAEVIRVVTSVGFDPRIRPGFRYYKVRTD